MKFGKYCLCLIIIGTVSLVGAPKNDHLRGLVNYMKEESKLYQVMFVVDDLKTNSSSKVNTLVQIVSEQFPTLSISLSNFRNQFITTNYWSSLQRPWKTTLFILVVNGNLMESWIQLEIAVTELKLLSLGEPNAKCLIIPLQYGKLFSIKRFLHGFWTNDFLDVTVLTQSNEFEGSLMENKINQSALHWINPFSRIYLHRDLKSNEEWFPNKLRNMHGHELRFLSYLDKSYNFTRETKEFAGRFADLFSTVMNCKGKLIYKKGLSTAVVPDLLQKGRMELMVRTIAGSTDRIDSFMVPAMRITQFTTTKAMIPKGTKLSTIVIVSQELITMLCVTAGAIVIIRITALILKFNGRIWQQFNISKIMMGMSIGQEPEKLLERIALGTLLLICIAYSSYFYSIILDLSFQSEPQITTIKELVNSSLTPMTDLISMKSMLLSPNSDIQELATKTIGFSDKNGQYQCFLKLIKHENVSCIVEEAERKKKTYEFWSKTSGTKIIQQPLMYNIKTWLSRYSSPYIGRFNEIILRASEAGLLAKLFETKVPDIDNAPPGPEEIGKKQLLLISCYVLAFGFSASMIVFIVEILSSVSWARVRLFCVRMFNTIREKMG